MKKFIKAFDTLNDVLQSVASVLLLSCCSLVFLSVILRYCFHISFQWTEEVARYLHIGVVLILLGPLMWIGGHISVDLILQKLQGRARKIVRMIGEAASFALITYTFYFSIIYVKGLKATGVRTFSSKFEQWMPTMIVPIGFFFGVIFCIALIIREIVQFKKEEREHNALSDEIADILATNNLTVENAEQNAEDDGNRKKGG